MNSPILLGAAISGLIGFLLAIPALIAQWRRAKDPLPMLMEVRFVWTWKLRPSEVFWISLLFHLLISTVVGGLYVALAHQPWLQWIGDPFGFISVIGFTLLTWLILQLIVFPLLKMGFFARREGAMVWMETLVTHLLIGVGFWLVVHWYQPFFF